MHDAACRRARTNCIIELASHRRDRALDQPRTQDAPGRVVPREHKLPHQGGVLHDDGTLIVIAPRDFRQQLLQAATGDGIVGGKISAAEERRAVGGEKNGERPAVQTREPLDRRLVALRDIRPLIPVHANGDEERVDERADFRIGVDRAIGLGAPAAPFATDVEQNRPVELRRKHEGITSPRLPPHRLAGGAREIVRGGVGHAIAERPALGDAGGCAEDEK